MERPRIPPTAGRTPARAAREWLAINGFDPVYGARPLRRLIQTAIGDQLARALLSGDVRDGDEVVVDVLDGFGGGSSGLVVTRAGAATGGTTGRHATPGAAITAG